MFHDENRAPTPVNAPAFISAFPSAHLKPSVVSLYASNPSSLHPPTKASLPSRKAQRVALSDVSNASVPHPTCAPLKRTDVRSRAESLLQDGRGHAQRGLKAAFNGAALGTSRSFSGLGERPSGAAPLLSSASFSLHSDAGAGAELQGLKRKASEGEDDDEEAADADDEDVEVAIHADPDAKDVDMAARPSPPLPSIRVDASHLAEAMAISPSSAASARPHPTAAAFTHTNVARPTQSHLLVSDYQATILSHLLHSQSVHQPSPSYLAALQPDLNPRMREILIDWMHEVTAKFRLQQETLFLSIHITDRFLSHVSVARRRLQLLGCVALLLACKYEEMLVPDVDDFVHISDKAYTREEVIAMEATVLNVLHFELTSPSPLRFVECMEAQERTRSGAGEGVGDGGLAKELAVFLLHITLQSYRFLHYRPALLALACWLLAARTMRGEVAALEWRRAGQAAYRCEEGEVTQCMEAVWESWRQMNLREGEEGELGLVGSKYRAVERRFSKDKGSRVAHVQVVRPTQQRY